ncbi:MAG: phosphoserine aminotransferase, partial [Pseudomonadota bacterium]
SMLCVEDYIDALNWARSIGGLSGLIERANTNLGIIEDFVNQSAWIDFLAIDPSTRSNTSVCLTISDDRIKSLAPDEQAKFAKAMCSLLEAEEIAFDIGAYRDAPPGLRIWTGATVEAEDLKALMPWLEWAFLQQLQTSGIAEAA